MNIIQAIEDPKLLRPFFRDLGTWRAWLIYLRGLFGLPIEGDDRRLFLDCTGLTEAPKEKIRESYVIAGRRAGKSFISAVIAVYLSCFIDWKPYLSPGETGWIFILSVDKMQSRIIRDYIKAILNGCRFLKKLIRKETSEEIELSNGVTIAIKTSNYRSVRGYTLLACIMEELAFWRSEESANPDREVLAAVRPALSTIPDSLLIGISTPYSRAGVLWDQYKGNFGQPGRVLIWKAATRTMNENVDADLIKTALKEDPAAARSEWEAEWRDDISSFLSSELIEGCVIPGRLELPPAYGVSYFGFVDPSGGRGDSMSLGVAHKDPNTGWVILDKLIEKRPPFYPLNVVNEFAEICRQYSITSVKGDSYSAEWVSQAFRDQRISYQTSKLNKSEIFLNFLPLATQRRVELLDDPRLKTQLANLERRTHSGGRDSIDHPPGLHDDCANSACGACVYTIRPGSVWRVL
jgi:hypothetical protein